MEQLVQLLPLVAIVLVFWLLVLRPASKRQKALRQLQNALQVGDRVMLSSGIFGTVRGLGEEQVEVQIADGVVVSVARGAIATRQDRLEQDRPGEVPPTTPGDGEH